ncbi:hypothetical protein NDU88_003313 [Pleurodeles waltl]|uniref:Uncharacterized protein n=1 Tax=Pleurodeles waltl TaxID=8319 RepID=A0AAV7V249_PLEWA|nr:hypothetical protein NDU88_003313 [Pleurodeles waltl]
MEFHCDGGGQCVRWCSRCHSGSKVTSPHHTLPPLTLLEPQEYRQPRTGFANIANFRYHQDDYLLKRCQKVDVVEFAKPFSWL